MDGAVEAFLRDVERAVDAHAAEYGAAEGRDYAVGDLLQVLSVVCEHLPADALSAVKRNPLVEEVLEWNG